MLVCSYDTPQPARCFPEVCCVSAVEQGRPELVSSEPGGGLSLRGADGQGEKVLLWTCPSLTQGWDWPCWTSLSALPARAAARCPAPWLSAVMPTVLLVPQLGCGPSAEGGQRRGGAVPISPILWRHGGGWHWLLPCCCLLGLDVTFGWCCQATRTAELFLCGLFSWGTNCIS